MKKFLLEFKKFALRGNVLDMAIGIIIGSAFTAIVKSLTDNFIQPILNWLLKGVPMTWELVGACAAAFLSAVVNFVLTAFILFLILKSINSLMALGKKQEAPAAPKTKTCPYCKSAIALDATRCPHCTSQLDE
ncbi:MAG: large conductance mechanosensitive channel protein MscL [Clostridia bacterium]|nr:large conductance mechanosensitive channel protein MscL [Clostridia bacterium]